MKSISLGDKGDRWTLDHDLSIVKCIAEHKPEKYPLPLDTEKKCRVYLKNCYDSGYYVFIDVASCLNWNPDALRSDSYNLAEEIARAQSGGNTRSINGISKEIEILCGSRPFPRRAVRMKPSPDKIALQGFPLYDKQLPQDLQGKNLFLLSKNRLRIGGWLGLEWIDPFSSALYAYPNLSRVNYAKMFNDILDYVEKKGFLVCKGNGTCRLRNLKAILEARPIEGKKEEQPLYSLYRIFKTEPWIPLKTSELRKPNNPVGIIMTFLLVELSFLLRRLLRVSIDESANLDFLQHERIAPAGEKAKDLLERVKVIVDKMENLQGNDRRCVPDFFAQDILNRLLEYSESVGKKVIDSGLLQKVDEKIIEINNLLVGLSKRTPLFPPFKILMRVLFELYVYVWAANSYATDTVVFQKEYRLNNGKRRTPDISVFEENNTNPKLLIDAKYKVDYNNHSNISKADLEQALDSIIISRSNEWRFVTPTGCQMMTPRKIISKVFDNKGLKRKNNTVPSSRIYTFPLTLPLLPEP